MTQKNLIIEYLKLHGSITPAKMAGKVFKDTMFGSETSKRCRELRAIGKLTSHGEGKFEVFYLIGQAPKSDFFKKFQEEFKPKEKVNQLF